MEKSGLSKTSLLATIPVALFGISWILEYSEANHTVYYTSLLLSIASMFLLLGVGWVKNFPVWTIHATGFCVLISIYLTSISIPGLTGGKLLGVSGLLPLAVTGIISLSINFSLEPLKQLYFRVKSDKSLLFFALYGTLPALLMFEFDEVRSLSLIPITILLTIITASGVLVYLNSLKKQVGILTLIFAAFVTNSIAIAVSNLF